MSLLMIAAGEADVELVGMLLAVVRLGAAAAPDQDAAALVGAVRSYPGLKLNIPTLVVLY